MAPPVANPTRSIKSPSFLGRHDPLCLLPSPEAVSIHFDPLDRHATLNVPDRIRSRALREEVLVKDITSRLSLSFSEYSDYYEPLRAETQIIGRVSDGTPTDDLEWEIGG